MTTHLGLPVIDSMYLTVSIEKVVKRIWRERLLSWQPWIATKTIIEKQPDPNLYCFTDASGRSIVIGHPAITARLTAELIEKEEHSG